MPFSSGTDNRQRDEEGNKNFPIVTKDEQSPGEWFCWRLKGGRISARLTAVLTIVVQAFTMSLHIQPAFFSCN